MAQATRRLPICVTGPCNSWVSQEVNGEMFCMCMTCVVLRMRNQKYAEGIIFLNSLQPRHVSWSHNGSKCVYTRGADQNAPDHDRLRGDARTGIPFHDVPHRITQTTFALEAPFLVSSNVSVMAAHCRSMSIAGKGYFTKPRGPRQDTWMTSTSSHGQRRIWTSSLLGLHHETLTLLWRKSLTGFPQCQSLNAVCQSTANTHVKAGLAAETAGEAPLFLKQSTLFLPQPRTKQAEEGLI